MQLIFFYSHHNSLIVQSRRCFPENVSNYTVEHLSYFVLGAFDASSPQGDVGKYSH